jgi:Peptidase family M28
MTSVEPFGRSEFSEILQEFCALGPRFVGTDGEQAAAAYIRTAFDNAGLQEVRFEPVSVRAYSPTGATCAAPTLGLDADCSGLQFTASGKASGEAVYLGRAETEADLTFDRASGALAGRIGVIHTAYPYAILPALIRHGIAGIVVVSEAPDGLLPQFSAQLYPPSEPPDFPGVPLSVPGVTVEAAAGRVIVEALSSNPIEMEIDHGAEYRTVTTQNVIGEIRGESDERVLIGAHYDTQWGVQGACDNATGVSGLIAFARRYAELRPYRTIVLAAFADEEHGCNGSLQYCRRHATTLPETTAMVNLDALGWAESAKRALWADPSIAGFCAQIATRLGWTLESQREAGSFAGSDYNPFIDGGVPAAFFWRYPPGNPRYHTEEDSVEFVDIDVACQTLDVAAAAVIELAQTSTLDLGRSRPSHRWLDLRPGRPNDDRAEEG